jgi:hypothetical protein
MTAMAAELARVEDKYAALQKEVTSIARSSLRSGLIALFFLWMLFILSVYLNSSLSRPHTP